MKNELLIRGIVLIAISLCFGIPATSYQVGTFSRAGPGLFPLLVSCIVGLIGLVMLVRAWFEKSAAMTFNFKNILIVLASLVGFVLIAEYVKVIVAIVYVVFVSTLAGTDYSVMRNLKICAVLIAIAYAFHAFLGLQLTLF
ncbi:MAG TPA: tripartite tricarboxylate transporter TctB family protein [Burkholderiaceae bacterium]|nr:tripartite tricarboxylate transporter TctB family protein [Burkholderiaceae bacterium]